MAIAVQHVFAKISSALTHQRQPIRRESIPVMIGKNKHPPRPVRRLPKNDVATGPESLWLGETILPNFYLTSTEYQDLHLSVSVF
jgi:hypothetical protein